MENIVIEVLNEEHGKKVIDYWRSLGYDVNGLVGLCTKEENSTYRYYGVINGEFNQYSSSIVSSHNAKIITLPSEPKKIFPRVMMVYNSNSKDKKPRVVIAEKNGVFITWNTATTFEEAEKITETVCWEHAEEISEPLEVTLKEVAEKFNVSSVKIVDK